MLNISAFLLCILSGVVIYGSDHMQIGILPAISLVVLVNTISEIFFSPRILMIPLWLLSMIVFAIYLLIFHGILKAFVGMMMYSFFLIACLAFGMPWKKRV